METVTDFILGGSKITADGDCSHEIKRHLVLGRKAMTNLDSILKSRDIIYIYIYIYIVMNECSNLLKSELARMSSAGLFHYVSHFDKSHLV